jgi:transposase
VPRPEAEAVAGIASAPIEVVLRNGRVLRVMTTTDAAVVARLAAVLEG